MSKTAHFRLGGALIIVLSALSIGGLLFLGFDAARLLTQTNNSWESYGKQSQLITRNLDQLQRSLGFGGFIHSFKNYVLRRDAVYLVNANESARDAMDAIEQLKQILPTEAERRHLSDIESTLQEYLANKESFSTSSENLSAEEIDNLVWVNDTKAVAGLLNLSRINWERGNDQRNRAQQTFNDGIVRLQAGSFIVILIMAAAVYLIVLERRSARASVLLKEAYEGVERLYEGSPYALISVLASGEIIRANREAESLFGYTGQELEGMTVEQLMPERFRGGHVGLREKYAEAPRYRAMQRGKLELYALRKSGEEVRIDVGISHFDTNEGMMFLLAIVDVTEAEKMRAELVAAREEALSASSAKSRFLASMSHEIRTPLNGILGLLQLIQSSEVSPGVAEKLRVARESGLFLLTLINQVLDFAKIESGTVTISEERFSLPAMINAMQSMFTIRTELKGVRFETDIDGNAERYFIADYDHIRQVLFNLIGNAVKFTETGSVRLHAAVTDVDESTCRITFAVIDTGPGIAPEDRHKIFEEFAQTDVGIREGGGTGLGLNISRKLCRLMGSELKLQSTVGHGSTFSFTINAGVSDKLEIAIEDEPGSSVTPARVLVAEDNDINQMIVRGMLERDGHEVVIAKNGSIAVDLVREDPNGFDLVLMDVQMPVMDGIQATVEIRQIVPDVSALPIIALTANAFQDQKMEYLSVGMQHVLTKPLDMAELRSTIARFIGKRDRPGTSVKAALATETVPGGDHIDMEALAELKKAMPADRLAALSVSLADNASRMVNDLGSGADNQHKIRIAHELTGMLGNFGLRKASLMSGALEYSARQGEDVNAAVAALENEIKLSVQLLNREIGS